MSLIILLFSRTLCNSQSVFFHAVYTQKLLAQALFLAHAQIIARSWLYGLLALIQSKGSLPDCFQKIRLSKYKPVKLCNVVSFALLILQDFCVIATHAVGQFFGKPCRALKACPGLPGLALPWLGLLNAQPLRLGKSRLLRNTYKRKLFLRDTYDLLGMHKIKRLQLCILPHIHKRVFRIDSAIFYTNLSVMPLFWLVVHFKPLPMIVYI